MPSGCCVSRTAAPSCLPAAEHPCQRGRTPATRQGLPTWVTTVRCRALDTRRPEAVDGRVEWLASGGGLCSKMHARCVETAADAHTAVPSLSFTSHEGCVPVLRCVTTAARVGVRPACWCDASLSALPPCPRPPVVLCCSPPPAFPPVSVKWGKDTFDVDVDPSLPGAVFKTQMFTLTGVPPERQKFTGIKNPPLKVRTDSRRCV